MDPIVYAQQQVDIYVNFLQVLANAALTGEQAQQIYLILNQARDIFHQLPVPPTPAA